MAFSFGSQAKPAFGTNTTTSTSGGLGGFGGFGTTATSTQPTGFSFGGAATTTAGFGGFTGFGGTGTNSLAGSTGFTFGAPATSGFSGFGAPAASTQASGFGFGQTTTTTSPSTGFGFGAGFGGAAAATTQAAGFGTGGGLFGTTTSTAGGGLFGTSTSTAGGLFGAGQVNAAVPQQMPAELQLAQMASAVSLPIIFGDERDSIISKWNQLQAYWGTGKGYFNQQGQSVDFTLDNPFCRFKAVGYSRLPDEDNADGLVAFTFNKKMEELSSKQQQVVDMLQQICVQAIQKLPGNKPTVSVCVESLAPSTADKCEMRVYLQERSPNGITRRIPASQTYALLNQTTVQQALSSQLSVSKLVPCLGFSKEGLKQYLDAPPSGIDPLLWQQVKLDNPNPDRLLPVPLLGFSDLNHRIEIQQHQTQLHQRKIDEVSEDITLLQHNHANTQAKIAEYKKRQMELAHRVLQVLVKQEIARKQGYAIQADEEQLRVQLEALQVQLNAPTQFKGRLNELMSQLRMQNQLGLRRSEAAYQMTSSAQQEVRQHLSQQQEGIHHLISIIKDDTEDLKLILQGLGVPS